MDRYDDDKKDSWLGCVVWAARILFVLALAAVAVFLLLGPPGQQAASTSASAGEWMPIADSQDEGDLRAFKGALGGTVHIAEKVYVTHSSDGTISVLLKNATLSQGYYECVGGTECVVSGNYGALSLTLNVGNYLPYGPVPGVLVTNEKVTVLYQKGGHCYVSNTRSGDINILCPSVGAQAAIDAAHPPPPPKPLAADPPATP